MTATGAHRLGYPVAAALLLVSLAILFAPAPTPPVLAPAPTEMVRPVVVGLDRASAEAAGRLGARFVFLSARAAMLEPAQDQPPQVLGIGKVGRRSFVYVASDTGVARRLAVGAEAAGWRLMRVESTSAEFSRAGEIRWVQLYRRGEPPAGRPPPPAAQ
jgi:hypothetical protein